MSCGLVLLGERSQRDESTSFFALSGRRGGSHDSQLYGDLPEVHFSPARLGEHDDGAGAALERGLDGADGHGLCGVTGQMRGATQLLEHLSVEHGGLGFTGDLNTSRKRITQESGCSRTESCNCRS